jgi:hypothetical protein
MLRLLGLRLSTSLGINGSRVDDGWIWVMRRQTVIMDYV